MAAAVRSVLPTFDTIDLCYRIVDSTGFQDTIKFITVVFYTQLFTGLVAEQRAGNLVFCQAIDDGLNFRGDSDNSILASLGFGTSGESLLFPVVVGNIQIQKFGRSEGRKPR